MKTFASLRENVEAGRAAAGPMMRWWWFGSHLGAEAIDADLDAMAAAGIGGVEVAFVYPLAPGGPRFGSDEYLALVEHAASAAVGRGLRFDLTLGAGWPWGGPAVDGSTAARRLHWERREVPPFVTDVEFTPSWADDEVIGAYAGLGSLQEPPEAFAPVEHDDGHLLLPASSGPRVLLVAVSRLTGQNVKRAPSGAEGLVLDHYSPHAVRQHLDTVAAPLLRAAGAQNVTAGFCDSFEVFDSDWTPSLPQEFSARRGYDPLPVLWQHAVGGDAAAGLLADLHRTLQDLFDEHFLGGLRTFCAGHGIAFRAQCYGEPPMTPSSYARVDLVEGEGWGWKTLTKDKWAASAASSLGRPVVSSETWTWVHSPSFHASPADLLGEAYEHFLSGANLIVGHGWPLGAALGAGQPMFYASGALDSRNPWWAAAAPGLFGTLAHVSAALQVGQRAAQVGVLMPTDQLRSRLSDGARIDLFRAARDAVGDDLVAAIRTRGLDLDLVDEQLLTPDVARRYAAVVVPPGARPSDAAQEALTTAAAEGGVRVLRPVDRAGLDRWLAEQLDDVPRPLRADSDGPADAIGVVTREEVTGTAAGTATVSLVVNTSAEPCRVRLTADGRHLTVWDPVTGAVLATSGAEGRTEHVLGSYQGVLVHGGTADAATDADADTQADTVAVPAGRAVLPLQMSGWSVARAGSPGESRPCTLPHVWEKDPHVGAVDGTCVYSTRFRVEAATDTVRVELPAGVESGAGAQEESGLRGSSFRVPYTAPVNAAASVTIDGRYVGSLWSTPFALTATGLGLAPGWHTLDLGVSNLGAHEVAVAAVGASTPELEAAHGRRFRLQDAGTTGTGVASGLFVSPQVTTPA